MKGNPYENFFLEGIHQQARNSEEPSRTKEEREKLPAAQVSNEVLWVNQKLEVPLDLKVGQSSRLGLFLDSRASVPDEGNTFLKMTPKHFRTGTLGSALFAEKVQPDQKGTIYRDIDLKGIGYNEVTWSRSEDGSYEYDFRIDPLRQPEGEELGETRGILDRKNAELERDLSENFHNLGIRTYRIISIIKLKEIINSGEKISVEEAKKRGIISEDEEPVVAVRAFGTHVRLLDLGRELRLENSRLSLDDAKNLVAKELNIDPATYSDQEYIRWYAREFGKSLGLMHKNGYLHKNVSAHNVTADARILDFDTVERSDTADAPAEPSFKAIPTTRSRGFNEGKTEDFNGGKSLVREVLGRSVLEFNNQDKVSDEDMLEIEHTFESAYHEALGVKT